MMHYFYEHYQIKQCSTYSRHQAFKIRHKPSNFYFLSTRPLKVFRSSETAIIEIVTVDLSWIFYQRVVINLCFSEHLCMNISKLSFESLKISLHILHRVQLLFWERPDPKISQHFQVIFSAEHLLNTYN